MEEPPKFGNFSLLTAGPHSFRTRRISDNTCVSHHNVVTINAQPTAPAPTASATTEPLLVQ
jgi:hypothetical protein